MTTKVYFYILILALLTTALLLLSNTEFPIIGKIIETSEQTFLVENSQSTYTTQEEDSSSETRHLRTIVLFNNDSTYNYDQNSNGFQDSYELALAYAIKRNIPLENLLGANCSRGNNYYYSQNTSYSTFISEIVEPLKDRLNAMGNTSVDYIAVMYGIPYRITVNTFTTPNNRALDSFLIIPFTINSNDIYSTYFGPTNPYYESSPSVASDKDHFNHSYNLNNKPMYLVSRLDGRDVDEIKDQILGALYGEKFIYNEEGYYRGTGYVDNRFGDYDNDFSGYPFGYTSYENGDKNMAYGKTFFENINYPFKRQVTESEIGENANFTDGSSATIAEDAILYEGWYNYGKYTEGFRWLPGSLAMDLNSNSASSLRTTTLSSFIAGAMQAGLTGGAGVTEEPYLNGHASPEVFAYYVLEGFTLAESGWISTPFLEWRSHVVGDPLYTPFGTKQKVNDSSFEKDLIVLDETYENNASNNRIINIFLTEGEPELAVFKILYGEDINLDNSTEYNFDYRYTKEFNLTNLTPSTTYYYKVVAKDPLGNLKYGEIYNFSTPSEDNEPIFSLSFTQDNFIAEIGNTTQFEGQSSCENCDYTWFFGDGTNSSGLTAEHSFSENGIYDIFLYATSNDSSVKKFSRGIVFVYTQNNTHVCGDATCEYGESCSACPTDCGACACETNPTNSSWSDWINISCLPSEEMNQSSYLITYDTNNCDDYENETFYDYRNTLYCNYSEWKPSVYFDNEIFDENETTNFSAFNKIQMQDLQQVKFKLKDGTKITFLETLNISKEIYLESSNIFEINEKWVYINSAELSEFNKSAEITFYNVNYANPQVYLDNSICPENICINASYDPSSETYRLNVTHFTNYSIQEGPYCGDSECNNGEGCSSCSTDCGTCSSSSPIQLESSEENTATSSEGTSTSSTKEETQNNQTQIIIEENKSKEEPKEEPSPAEKKNIMRKYIATVLTTLISLTVLALLVNRIKRRVDGEEAYSEIPSFSKLPTLSGAQNQNFA